MRPISVTVVVVALLAACGRGGASPLPADQPAAFNDADHDPSLLPGMLAKGQLEWLQTRTGAQFDRGFLTMMGTHHQGAVELAEAELRAGASTQAKVFARQLLAVQQREIRQMQQWKDTWT